MRLLTLYSRPDCHLCEKMIEELRPLVHGKAEISVVDISQDEELDRQYSLRIPVLAAGSEELSLYWLDRDAVERFLAESA